MADNLPKVLQLDGKHFIRPLPGADFLRVPRYNGFWEFIHQHTIGAFYNQVDQVNPDVYISPKVMIIAYESVTHHYYAYWDAVGRNPPDEKVACLEEALLRPRVFAKTHHRNLRKYWTAKMARFKITDPLADIFEENQLLDSRNIGPPADEADSKTDNHTLGIPMNTLCIRNKQAKEDRVPISTLCIRTKKIDEDEDEESESEPMDISD